jgi:Sigma-70, region 4
VLNGCRSEFRRRKTSRNQLPDAPAWSAESAALASEERREVLRALVRLPARQREALVLRYYLDLSEAETASAMRISRGLVTLAHNAQTPRLGRDKVPAATGGPHGATGGPAAASPGLPRYLVTTVDGQAAVHATASGQLIADIPRPADLYAYEGVAAAAGDRMFFLSGVMTSGGSWKIVFFKVVLGADGQPGNVRRLPGPPLVQQTPVISGGWVNFQFAVAPDGSELAYASGTPGPYGAGTPYGDLHADYPGINEHIIVQNVATGSRRTWSAWSSADAGISQFSWGPSGQLGYNAVLAHAGVSHGRIVRTPGGNISAFMILSTTAAGSDLISDSRVVTYTSLPSQGTLYEPHGLISPDGQLAYVQLSHTATSGQLAEVSAATGQTVRVLLAGSQASLGDPISIDSSGRYLIFPLGVQHLHVVNSQVPYVMAHLARLDLRTRRVTQLSITVMARINGAFDAAW